MRPAKRVIITATLAAILAAVAGWHRYQATAHLAFNTSVQLVESGVEMPIFQVFYNTGRGYRESEARSVLLKPGEEQSITFTIPSNRVYSLRLDVLNGPGSVVLQETALIGGDGRVLCPVSAGMAVEGNQLASLSVAADAIRLTTLAGANDPYLQVPFTPPCFSPVRQGVTSHLLFAGKIFAVLLLGFELLLLGSGAGRSPRRRANVAALLRGWGRPGRPDSG